MISINGTTLPSTTTYKVSIQDLSKGERNVNGLLLLERIATKRKIDLGWKMLTQAQFATILTLVSAVFLRSNTKIRKPVGRREPFMRVIEQRRLCFIQTGWFSTARFPSVS